jgi:hypothetical protein
MREFCTTRHDCRGIRLAATVWEFGEMFYHPISLLRITGCRPYVT